MSGPSLGDREIVKTYSYQGYWPWKVQYVYVMKRRGGPALQNIAQSGGERK